MAKLIRMMAKDLEFRIANSSSLPSKFYFEFFM